MTNVVTVGKRAPTKPPRAPRKCETEYKDETDFLLSSESNRKHLKESIAQMKRGELIDYEIFRR